MKRQAWTLSGLVERERLAWLDTLAGPLQETAHRVFRAGPMGETAKNWLNGVPFRHRVHPALIIWPLGAWTTAAFLDLLDSRAERHATSPYRAAADASLLFGLAGALPAIAAGLADWVDTYDHPRRVGMAHALLNTVAIACYGLSSALRRGDARLRGPARLAGACGLGAVTLGGALGGELVYTLGVNVTYLLFPRPPDRFVDVLASQDLVAGRLVVVEVERTPVLLLRHEDQIYAAQDWCPHAGGTLSEGSIEGAYVTCPLHDSRFCLADGAPRRGPATAPLRTFVVREAGGRIAVQPSYEGQSWPPAPPPPH